MPIIPANLDLLHIPGHGTFYPGKGRSFVHGRLPNPRAVISRGGTHSARLLVGLNVGPTPTWSMDDVVALVEHAWATKPERGATFVYAKGIWVNARGQKEPEDTVQVSILNLDGTAPATFRRRILGMAERMVVKLRQEKILVEFQVDGVSQAIYRATPPLPKRRSKKGRGR